MQNKNFDDDILYFEDLESNVQDAIIDYIVSIIENKMKHKEEQDA